MRIGPSLEMRQTQRLSMTPQLRQALKLLHMTHQDLLVELREALDNNPLLQSDEDLAAPTRAAPALVQPTESNAGGELNIDALPAAPTSLAAHISAQLGMANTSDEQIALARNLAQELEPDGYLRTPLGEIAARVNVPLAKVEQALRLLQSCEPSGVGARDLRECLALQLAEIGALDAASTKILARLDVLARGDEAELAAISGLNGAALQATLSRIRALNPRPGGAFQDDLSPVIVPEIFVRRDTFGQWHCELNPETLPKISINRAYAAALGKSRTGKTQMSKGWLDQANWLVRALQQRAENIRKVAEAIVEHQARFFEFGAEQMRPLSLRDIAAKTALHESTISRTVNGKYLTCRAGTFELRYFFTAALAATAGDGQFGAFAIRARIKRLIDEENQKKPLSDDDLVKILRASGVDIARRTVAKYRGVMGISSSVQRRRQNDTPSRVEG